MIIQPFRADHVRDLAMQPEQEYLRAWLSDVDLLATYEAGDAFTLLGVDGRTLACAGVVKLWPGRAQAWCIFSAHIGGLGMVAATRAVRRFLDLRAVPRIEAHVDHNFPAGHRWMRLLGFSRETPDGMPNFIDGRTFDLYARVHT